MSEFDDRGWVKFPFDRQIHAWSQAAYRAGLEAVQDPKIREDWLDCEGTWFIGVDALPNAADGTLEEVPLAGAAIDFLGPLPPLHRAQLSVTYPGYPRPRKTEGEAAFRYRAKRDAAHVDGILPHGPDRRRQVTEPHAFVLGMPVTQASAEASPLVIWDGSHKIMHEAFRALFLQHPQDSWATLDVTETYQAARKRCFEECDRLPIHAKPGEAILMHRHCLHGVAPWGEGALAPEEGRMVAYFRPEFANGIVDWISEKPF
jgi:hypothetical protein